MLQVGEEMHALVEGDPEAESSRSRALDAKGGALLPRPCRGRARRRAASPVYTVRRDPDPRHSLGIAPESLLADSDLGASHVSELSAVLTEAREIVTRIGDELGTPMSTTPKRNC